MGLFPLEGSRGATAVQLKERTELRTSLVVVHQPAILQDLDVTDIQCEVICPLMAFMRRRLYKQL